MAKKRMLKPRRIFKKRPCRLCKGNVDWISYDDVEFLEKFVSDRGKIMPTRLSGNCSKHQRMVANRIKKARIAGLLPYVKIKQGVQRERHFTSRH